MSRSVSGLNFLNMNIFGLWLSMQRRLPTTTLSQSLTARTESQDLELRLWRAKDEVRKSKTSHNFLFLLDYRTFWKRSNIAHFKTMTTAFQLLLFCYISQIMGKIHVEVSANVFSLFSFSPLASSIQKLIISFPFNWYNEEILLPLFESCELL